MDGANIMTSPTKDVVFTMIGHHFAKYRKYQKPLKSQEKIVMILQLNVVNNTSDICTVLEAMS